MKFYAKIMFSGALLAVTALLCMESDTKRAKTNEVEQVYIQTQEGQEFKIPLPYAKLSNILALLIEDAGIDSPLPLPNIAAEQFQQIDTLLSAVYQIPEDPVHAEKLRNGIIDVLQKLDTPQLISFIQAVNYLDIPLLLDLALHAVARNHKKVPKEMLRLLPLDLVRKILHYSFSVPDFEPIHWESEDDIHSVALTPDKKLLLELNHKIEILNFAKLEVENSYFSDGRAINWIEMTPDGRKIIIEYEPSEPEVIEPQERLAEPVIPQNNISVYDRAHTEEPIELQGSSNANLAHSYVTPDSKKFIQVMEDGLHIWDLMTGLKEKYIRAPVALQAGRVVVDTTKIYALLLSNVITIYDMKTGVKFGQLTPIEKPIKLLAWLNPQTIIGQLDDGTLVVWNILNYRITHTLPPLPPIKPQLLGTPLYDGATRTFLVGPNGSKVVVIDPDGIKLWDLKERRFILVAPGNYFGVPQVALTHGGASIIAQKIYDYDSVLYHIYDLETGRENGVLQGTLKDEEVLAEHIFVDNQHHVCAVFDDGNHQEFIIWDISLLQKIKNINFVQAQIIWHYLQTGNATWAGIEALLDLELFKKSGAPLPTDAEINQLIGNLARESNDGDASSSAMDVSE